MGRKLKPQVVVKVKDDRLEKHFHNWVSFCKTLKFPKPDEPGYKKFWKK